MTDFDAHAAARLAPRGDLGARRQNRPARAFAVLRQLAPEGRAAR